MTCAKPIAEKCASGSCPSFDEAATAARKPQSEGSMFRYWIGTCGSDRFIRVQEGMGMGTDYYGADGKLIASSSVADSAVCGGSDFGLQQGSAPQCEMKVLEHGDSTLPRESGSQAARGH